MNLSAISKAGRLPAMRRDPLRMVLRPLLRPIDSYLSRKRTGAQVRQDIGLGAVVEYSIAELLDRSRYLYGTYEYVYASAFVGQVTPGSVVVDVGANIGEYALLAALATGPEGRVFAIEPNVALHPRMLRLLEINAVFNVEVLSFALGSSETRGVLTIPLGATALGTLRQPRDFGDRVTTMPVSIRRLDDILVDEDRRRLSVVKVDVEGWELEVFQGARQTLAEIKPAVLYECGEEQFAAKGGRRLTPSMSFLEDLGYRNHTIRMTRGGRWELRPVEAKSDPLADREPWSVLMIVALHPEGGHPTKMRGQSPLARCGVLEMLGHPS